MSKLHQSVSELEDVAKAGGFTCEFSFLGENCTLLRLFSLGVVAGHAGVRRQKFLVGYLRHKQQDFRIKFNKFHQLASYEERVPREWVIKFIEFRSMDVQKLNREIKRRIKSQSRKRKTPKEKRLNYARPKLEENSIYSNGTPIIYGDSANWESRKEDWN